MVMDCYAVSRLKLGYSGSDLGYRARDFVAEYPGCGNETLLDLFEIRTANAAGMHAQQNLSTLNLRNRNFLDGNIGWAAINGCTHFSSVYRRQGFFIQDFHLLALHTTTALKHQIVFAPRFEIRS
jgi:hypothetical protein